MNPFNLIYKRLKKSNIDQEYLIIYDYQQNKLPISQLDHFKYMKESEIIEDIKNNNKVFKAESKDGTYIDVIVCDGTPPYIRTSPNNSNDDNLLNLPTY